MLAKTHTGTIKSYNVEYTNFENCISDLRTSGNKLEDQMCVRLPIAEYSEIYGRDYLAGSSSHDFRLIKEVRIPIKIF